MSSAPAPPPDFEPAAVRLEGRYKLLSAADAPFDLVLYAELEKEVVDDKPWGIEEKLILGRSYSAFSWAANLIAEQEFPAAGGHELKLGWSAGAAVEPVRGLRLGAESFGWRTREVDGVVEWTAWAGPTGSVALPFLARGRRQQRLAHPRRRLRPQPGQRPGAGARRPRLRFLTAPA